VSRQAYENLKKIESGENRKVGVNCYRIEEEEQAIEFHPVMQEDVDAQLRKLEAVKADRDAGKVQAALDRVLDDARAGRNVMPSVKEAVKAYATVGEITERLVVAFGKFKEPIRF